MLFLIFQRSYILGRVIEATPTSPKIERLPDNTDLDHVSSQWHPLDDSARDAHKRLAVQTAERRANPDDGAGARGAALRTALKAIQKQQNAAEEQRALQDAQAEVAKAIAEGTLVAAAEAGEIEDGDPVPPPAPAGAAQEPAQPLPPKPLTRSAREAKPPRPSDTSPIGG